MQEDKYSESSYFITLTYDSEHVPITDNGFLSLKISDVQDFFKAIRKLHDKQYHIVSDFRKTGPNCNAKPERPSIKYYTAGEYGTKGRRPHYHSIVFNLDLKLITDHADHLLLKHTKFDGITEIRLKGWPHGHATVGMVSGASVGYTLKYMCKSKWRPMHKNDDRLPERSLMSKHLGHKYLTDQMMKWHKEALTERMYINVGNGIKAAMPRYYKNKIYSDAERSEIGGHLKGKMEVETVRAIQRYEGNSSFSHSKNQAIKADFRNMEAKEKQRQKL